MTRCAPLLSLAALLLGASSTSAVAQAPADPRISEDGTVLLDGVVVPLPALMSREGRDYLRHLIVDKPFGTPVPDLAEERRRQDGIMFGFLPESREAYAIMVDFFDTHLEK